MPEGDGAAEEEIGTVRQEKELEGGGAAEEEIGAVRQKKESELHGRSTEEPVTGGRRAERQRSRKAGRNPAGSRTAARAAE